MAQQVCTFDQEANRFINQMNREAALEARKESLIGHYRELILNGEKIVIDRIPYSFDDVISDAAYAETIDSPMMALLRGNKHAAKNLEKALEEQLEKLLSNMADAKIEEETDEF